jgi:hypothetical protein
MARALLPEKGASKIYIAISYSGQNVWLFRKIPRVSMSHDLCGALRQLKLHSVVAPMLGIVFYPDYRDFVIETGTNGPIHPPYRPAKTARKSANFF